MTARALKIDPPEVRQIGDCTLIYGDMRDVLPGTPCHADVLLEVANA